METEGVTFPEAVERLAEAGVPMPTSRRRRRSARSGARRCTTSSSSPRNSSRRAAVRAGAKARGYLADRGLEPATQLRFRIGYAPPERFALKEHLGAQGVRPRT